MRDADPNDDIFGEFFDTDENDSESSFDDVDFESFDNDDEFGSMVVEELELRTAILQKDNMFGLLGMMSASSSATICRVDPRESAPAYQLYEDVEAAHKWFTRSLGTSRRNGWDVLYDGLPLRG